MGPSNPRAEWTRAGLMRPICFDCSGVALWRKERGCRNPSGIGRVRTCRRSLDRDTAPSRRRARHPGPDDLSRARGRDPQWARALRISRRALLCAGEPHPLDRGSRLAARPHAPDAGTHDPNRASDQQGGGPAREGLRGPLPLARSRDPDRGAERAALRAEQRQAPRRRSGRCVARAPGRSVLLGEVVPRLEDPHRVSSAGRTVASRGTGDVAPENRMDAARAAGSVRSSARGSSSEPSNTGSLVALDVAQIG